MSKAPKLTERQQFWLDHLRACTRRRAMKPAAKKIWMAISAARISAMTVAVVKMYLGLCYPLLDSCALVIYL